MSKLYLTARTDTGKTDKTARGNNYIFTKFGYDPGDYSKKIGVDLVRHEDNDLTLGINDQHGKRLMVCHGSVKEGLTHCQSGSEPYKTIHF